MFRLSVNWAAISYAQNQDEEGMHSPNKDSNFLLTEEQREQTEV